MLWTSVQILIALPPLTAALIMVLLDRNLGAHFFDPQNGGSAILYQHMFWFFGHPEVYILILPVFGIVSEVIPVFSRKVLFGYEFMAAATAAIAFISLSVWAHHMFTVGMTRPQNLFFVISTLLVSVPTGIKFFNWLATMYGGRISLESPMLFACGFLAMFLIGGLTGIMLASAPFNFQLNDSYFVVGHFHWVLIGGTIFGVFAGIHYWYPKVTGRMLSEGLARWQFWLLLIGFFLTFGPMHISGMLGMPRRIFTYEPDRDHRGSDPSAELCNLCRQYPLVAEAWETRRPRSVECLDAGMGHFVAPSRLQLRGSAGRAEPPSSMGFEAPR